MPKIPMRSKHKNRLAPNRALVPQQCAILGTQSHASAIFATSLIVLAISISLIIPSVNADPTITTETFTMETHTTQPMSPMDTGILLPDNAGLSSSEEPSTDQPSTPSSEPRVQSAGLLLPPEHATEDSTVDTVTTGQSSISHRLLADQLIPLATETSGTIEEDMGEGSGDEGSVLSSREIKAVDLEIFKRQLLRKMGLNGRPAVSDHRSVLPLYLWDIYDNVVEGATLSSISDFAHVQHENDMGLGQTDDIGESQFTASSIRSYFDTVRTFFAAGNPLWPTTLLFDMHRLPSNERWVEAELRVPWHNLLSNSVNLTKSGLILNQTLSLEDGSALNELRKHFIRINLYEVVNETVDIRHLIDTKVINTASTRLWTSFDVLSIVSRASMKLNVVKLAVEFVDVVGHGQSIFVTSNDDQDTQHSPALIMYGFDDDGKDKPIKYKNFYKYYMDEVDDEGTQHNTTTRRKRQANNKKRQRASSRPRLEQANHRPSSNRRPNQQQQNLCQRRPLTIRFEDLNWQDWILAPQEYTAYYCSGQCSYPFADSQNTTNHAIVQALVNSVSPRTAPKPCCVPTETSSISMLYTDIDRNIVIKNYPDMIVEGCGCR